MFIQDPNNQISQSQLLCTQASNWSNAEREIERRNVIASQVQPCSSHHQPPNKTSFTIHNLTNLQPICAPQRKKTTSTKSLPSQNNFPDSRVPNAMLRKAASDSKGANQPNSRAPSLTHQPQKSGRGEQRRPPGGEGRPNDNRTTAAPFSKQIASLVLAPELQGEVGGAR